MYWDPLRKKNVPETPEEKVRQWFIVELNNTFGVPMHMMMSETGFRFGGKQYRADILVYDREAKPLLVVECKEPGVAIDAEVARQALRYNAVLDVRYIVLTNGISTYAYERRDDAFAPLRQIPSYEIMTCRH